VFVDASACFREFFFGADTVETARVLVFGYFATKRFFTESGERGLGLLVPLSPVVVVVVLPVVSCLCCCQYFISFVFLLVLS
jgi:hypothetical protein